MSDKPHPQAVDFNGHWYLRNAKGALVPHSAIKPIDLLIDELVREMRADALELAARIRDFKQSGFERVGALNALLAQDFNTSVGGAGGNITLTSYDGCAKVQIAVAERITFGPELQVAKAMIDDCLTGWSATSHPYIRALVDRVFSVEKEGAISHTGIFMLFQVNIEDEKWQRAMDAIRASIRPVGSTTYIRIQDRDTPDDDFRSIPLNIARA